MTTTTKTWSTAHTLPYKQSSMFPSMYFKKKFKSWFLWNSALKDALKGLFASVCSGCPSTWAECQFYSKSLSSGPWRPTCASPAIPNRVRPPSSWTGVKAWPRSTRRATLSTPGAGSSSDKTRTPTWANLTPNRVSSGRCMTSTCGTLSSQQARSETFTPGTEVREGTSFDWYTVELRVNGQVDVVHLVVPIIVPRVCAACVTSCEGGDLLVECG